MIRSAILSDCGRYRYRLSRAWGVGPRAVFVMLNPSTADAYRDDPTIRRCVAYARRERLDALDVVNLYALRSTDPRELLRPSRLDPVGPDNLDHIAAAAETAELVVVAWGAHTAATERIVAQTRSMLGPVVYALGVTKAGAPRHPLYVRADAPLVEWAGP